MCFCDQTSHRWHLTDITTTNMRTACNYLPKHFWGQSSLIWCNKCISNPCKTTSWAEICKFNCWNTLSIVWGLICSKGSITSTTTLPPQQPNTVQTSALNECINYITIQQTSVKHLHHMKCPLCQKLNSRCMNSPSNRSLANPGSAPVERTKSDRTASISKVMWSWIHRLMGDIHTEKKKSHTTGVIGQDVPSSTWC